MLNLWMRLGRKSITNEELAQKARTVASFLVAFISEATPTFYRDKSRQYGWGVDEHQLWQLVLDDAIFCLHVIDRYALGGLGPEKRAVFMDNLLPEVREILSRLYETGADASRFPDEFVEIYNASSAEYAQYKKMMAEEGEPLKGTLYWEFAKKRADLLGITNPAEIMLIGFCALSTIKSLSDVLTDAGVFG